MCKYAQLTQKLVQYSFYETHLLFLDYCETVLESFTFLNNMSPSEVQAGQYPSV
jgi:hypothetical protein